MGDSIPTIKVKKGERTITINEADKAKFFADGWKLAVESKAPPAAPPLPAAPPKPGEKEGE